MPHGSSRTSQNHQTGPWTHPPTPLNSHLSLPGALSQLRWPKETSLIWAALNPGKQIHSLHTGSIFSVLAVIKKENPKHYKPQGNKKEQDTLTNQDYSIYVPEGRSTETLKQKVGSWRCHHNPPIWWTQVPNPHRYNYCRVLWVLFFIKQNKQNLPKISPTPILRQPKQSTGLNKGRLRC